MKLTPSPGESKSCTSGQSRSHPLIIKFYNIINNYKMGRCLKTQRFGFFDYRNRKVTTPRGVNKPSIFMVEGVFGCSSISPLLHPRSAGGVRVCQFDQFHPSRCNFQKMLFRYMTPPSSSSPKFKFSISNSINYSYHLSSFLNVPFLFSSSFFSFSSLLFFYFTLFFLRGGWYSILYTSFKT